MATDVRVDIRDAYVISALNTPGGAVNEWRNNTEHEVLVRCVATSPVNDILNAVHRIPRVPGTFQRAWVTRRQGNGHRIGFQIENFADHAIYVEEGRSASTKYQRFSWTGWHGEIRAVGRGTGSPSGTRARKGQHVLRNAVNEVLIAATGGSYTPLV